MAQEDDKPKDDAAKDRAPYKTNPGYGPLGSRPADTLVDDPNAGDRRVPPTEQPPAPAPAPAPAAAPTHRGTPVIEIEVIHEHGPAPSTDRPFRTVEVWTRNRIYTLDAVLVCIEVTDRASRQIVGDHPFLGMRLVGGQHREGERIELSHPFPRPGTEAVFEEVGDMVRPGRAGGFSRTSAVSRVVLRLHIVTVMPNHVVPTWEEITGSILPPPINGD
ncbi:MAG: hypothetical protein JRH11_02500 [Deltaproteobacteria bacterium]|nr:hypothetical protein [Deltaproteobacteria bacterium]